MNRSICIAVLLSLFGLEAAVADGVEQILGSYVADYRNDPMLEEGTFGIRIGDEGRWHVIATAATEDSPAKATLHKGDPNQPTWFFQLDNVELLEKFDRGELAAGTSMAKAFSSDKTPMDVDSMEGFTPDEKFVPSMMSTLFHFWNRGLPEVTQFSADRTRFTHGTDVVILHYQPGLRSAWFSIKPGQHVNADERSRSNPFPSMIIITRGKGMAKIGGVDSELRNGQSVFIPPGIDHEFTNPFDAPMEGVLLMFGEGA